MAKVSTYGAITPAYDDLLYLVDDPSGTPASGTASLADLYKAGKLYPPEMFGATADGVADDRSAIQAAIDAAESAGGGLILLTGEYLVGQNSTNNYALLIQGDNITLAGGGRIIFDDPSGVTSYIGIHAENANVPSPAGESNWIKNFSVIGLELDCSNVTAASLSDVYAAPIGIFHGYNCTVDSCNIDQAWGTNILTHLSSRACRITNNTMTDSQGYVNRGHIYGDGAQRHVIQGNTIINSGTPLAGTTGILLQSNNDNGAAGEIKYNIVFGNLLYNGCRGYGIRIKGGTYNTVAANAFYTTTTIEVAGISLSAYSSSLWEVEASYNMVFGNTMTRTNTYGKAIIIDGEDASAYDDNSALLATGNMVFGNRFAGPSGGWATGIELGEQATYNIVTDNYFKNVTTRLTENASAANNVVTFTITAGSTRPANPIEGMQFFDTDDGIPLWYDGSNWIDAAGNTV